MELLLANCFAADVFFESSSKVYVGLKDVADEFIHIEWNIKDTSLVCTFTTGVLDATSKQPRKSCNSDLILMLA